MSAEQTDAAGPPQDREMARVAADAVARQPAHDDAGAASTVGDTGATSAAADGADPTAARDELVSLLNDDLRTEYQSIVQYVQHVATLRGAEYLGTIAELRAHLTQELHHALVLAEQVDFLGGTPSVSVPDVVTETDTVAALELDLALEQRQLERYRERVRQANDAGLPDVAEALRPLLEQTQEHVRDLHTALGG